MPSERKLLVDPPAITDNPDGGGREDPRKDDDDTDNNDLAAHKRMKTTDLPYSSDPTENAQGISDIHRCLDCSLTLENVFPNRPRSRLVSSRTHSKQVSGCSSR